MCAMRLVLATGNAGKLQELRELLAPPAFEVLPQSQFTAASAEETGLTFVENAILKARHAAKASGLPAIADDSGLEVDALRARLASTRLAMLASTRAMKKTCASCSMFFTASRLRNAPRATNARWCSCARRSIRRRWSVKRVGRAHRRRTQRSRRLWLRSDLRTRRSRRDRGGVASGGKKPAESSRQSIACAGRTAAQLTATDDRSLVPSQPWPCHSHRFRSTCTCPGACVNVPYCDFNSHVAPEHVPQAQYIDALLEDLQSDLSAVQQRPLTSIFFGGGTPSLFAPEQVGRLLQACDVKSSSLPISKSRWKPIRARSSTAASPVIATLASIACR